MLQVFIISELEDNASNYVELFRNPNFSHGLA